MKTSRLIVVVLAVGAGATALWLMSAPTPPPAPAPVVQAPPPIPTDEVLVAAKALPMGTLIGASDVAWQPWPLKNIADGMLRRGANPDAAGNAAGAVTRADFFPGEPIRPEKIVKAGNSGFMSAILPAGYRALAISIDSGGKDTAGNFILPNDRVDVIRTYKDEEATRAAKQDVYASETVIGNVRVLAIGQNIQEKNGERVVVGNSATLELDPHQVEVVVLAQKIGQLSLALRSMLDASTSNAAPPTPQADKAVNIVRYGVPGESR